MICMTIGNKWNKIGQEKSKAMNNAIKSIYIKTKIIYNLQEMED